MRFDYWNNPLVVSAFRVKYRRGSPGTTTSLFVLALVGVGILLFRYDAKVPGMSWIDIYVLILLSVQFVVAAGYAITATSTSMRAEVSNRTLDFQRIASLSPRAILLGKLIGEPVSGYFMALAAVPLVLFCAFVGAITFAPLLLLYVQVITASLMCGSAGLVQPLEPAAKATSTGRGEGGGWGVIVFMFIIGTQSVFNSGFLSQIPGFAATMGLFTPIMTLKGLAAGDPWSPGLEIYGVHVPFLILGPIVQLALAALLFESMARRLVNPLNPPLDKRRAYLVLTLSDMLVAGAVFGDGAPAWRVLPATAEFCLFHLLASFVLMFSVTPRREELMSWVWRFRGQVPWARDSALGARSENSAVLVIFAAIGVVSLALLVWLPIALTGGGQVLATETASLLAMPALMAILLLSLGVFYQLLVLVAPSGGKFVFYLIVALAVATPATVGAYYRFDWLQALSPAAHFIDWLGSPARSLPLTPVFVLYAVVLLYGWRQLRQWINSYVRIVDRKLAVMQADKAT